jgi:hypothetical protein
MQNIIEESLPENIASPETSAKREKRVPANFSGTPQYATSKHPLIEAITAKLFRFSTHKQALERLESLKLLFTVGKQQISTLENPSLILWIKGFDVTPEEKKKGYMGNFAILSIEHMESAQFTLQAQKLEVEFKYHPMRRVTKAAHPNWGHPLLRRIQKDELFEDVEAARKILQNIHKAYPECSILCTNKLYTIIFTREGTENDIPTQKYVLELKPQAEGGFRITYTKNTYKAPKKVPNRKTILTEANTPESLQKAEPQHIQPQGRFTKLIQEKRDKN